jgi:hypothetical protein
MGTKTIGMEPLWAMKLAGDAIADETVRRRYLEKLAAAARRVSAVARDRPHLTRQSAFSPVWDSDPSCAFDAVLARRETTD